MNTSDAVEGLVHAETQVHPLTVDLTAARIERVTDAGRLDFGGDELAGPGVEAVGTLRRSDDDDYGWWNLQPGQYRLAFNESLADAASVRLEPRPALLASGGWIPTVTVGALDPVPLGVPTTTGDDVGLRIKENARVARVFPVDHHHPSDSDPDPD